MDADKLKVLGIWRKGGLHGVPPRYQAEIQSHSKWCEVVDLYSNPSSRVDMALVTQLEIAHRAVSQRLSSGTPYVLKLSYDHAEVAFQTGKLWKSVAWKAFRASACRWASGIIVTANDYVRKWSLTRQYDSAVAVIKNGVDINRFSPSIRRNDKRILAVGRLAPVKNLEILVRAVGRLVQDHKIVLTLVGTGTEQSKLAALARELGVSLNLPGQDDRIPWYLQDHNVFVMPSLTEGSPKALWEALATGIPCVVSRAIPDIRQYPVFTHDPTNDEELARLLEVAIVTGRTTHDSAKRGRDMVLANHNLSDNIGKEIRFLKSVWRDLPDDD
jgi:glycosyltransferase involved in cell wall biosynthesis